MIQNPIFVNHNESIPSLDETDIMRAIFTRIRKLTLCMYASGDDPLKSCLSIKRRKERYGGRLASASSEAGKREEARDYPLETYNRLRGEPSNSVFNPLARRRNVHHTS